MTSPYRPLAPHLAHLIVSDAFGFFGISNLALPHEHLMSTVVVVIPNGLFEVGNRMLLVQVTTLLSHSLRISNYPSVGDPLICP